MKLDRLIGILSLLLQRETVTTTALAERFEVSRRTIQRDIDTLCRAGVPLTTTRGAGGGIAIVDGYRIDRTILTAPEMQAILAGLRSLDSVSGTRRYAQLMDKLSAGTSQLLPGGGPILIDLSSWYKTSLPPKIECIRAALETHHALSFTYFSPKGTSHRTVEPCHLVFHWSSWYLWAWCRTREDYRLFKLTRMTELAAGAPCAPRTAPLPDLDPDRLFPAVLQAEILFAPACQWRLVDEYGADSFTVRPDGRLHFVRGFPDEESLLHWLLAFGDQAELLAPAPLRTKLVQLAQRLLQRYRDPTP